MGNIGKMWLSMLNSQGLDVGTIFCLQPEIHVTSKFTATNLYMVAVSSNTGEQEVMNITCDQSLTTCSASFPLLKAADYTVSISARNIVGGSDTAIYPNGICMLSCTPICTRLKTYTHIHTSFLLLTLGACEARDERLQ